MAKLKHTIVPLFVLLLVWTCASERPITGGPVDLIPPQVVFSTPVNETVNTSRKTDIYIKFNEQMKQSTVKSALQIWPSPPGEYEIKTGWTWVRVTFEKPLSENETYLLTLDKSAQDLRGNELESTYVLAFSTGDSLNAGHISGLIYGDKSISKNGDLLLYRKFDLPLSELRSQVADYVFQPDDQGNFELSYLAEQSYLLFYHWDRNRNKRIDGDDYFGRPMLASVQARSDSSGALHKIWPQLMPMEKVRLLGVSELGENFVQIRTNRPWNLEDIDGFSLFANDQNIPVLGTSRVEADAFALQINLASSIEDGSQVWIYNFLDTSGYRLSSDTLMFKRAKDLDTLSLLPFNVEWNNVQGNNLPSDSNSILIRAKLPFSFKADSAFHLSDVKVDSIPIQGSLRERSSTTWEFLAKDVLKDGIKYKWQIETKYLEAPLNGSKLDSIVGGSLALVSRDSLGGIRLMQMSIRTLECRLLSKDLQLNFRLQPNTAYEISNLPAQNYTLVAFLDSDGNGRYSSGGMGLAEGAEPFWIYPDVIKVRARWETDLGLWRYRE
ncbi:MAG: Ig-like domain-containing protein [Candidatus Marinimicrobia bacterium]|nr:Ig-like domain-containing protein [Candidatus Neomarinimicrobiota bacterium]